MAIACLAAEAKDVAEKLARRGYALVDGSGIGLPDTVAAFDALRANDEPTRIAPDHPLVAMLLAEPAVRELIEQAIGPEARPLRVMAFDGRTGAASFQPWHQSQGAAGSLLTLRWHLDLIGPADGGLRVLPGSHRNGRLTAEQIAALPKQIPAVELPVSAGTVVALDPLLVRSARRRATRGHRRTLQVELER